MVRLPPHLAQEHIDRQGNRLILTIKVDTSQYLAQLANLGPAWDRIAAQHDRFRAALLAHHIRHHRRERADRSTMHAAYDRRRRARRRRR